MIFLLIIIVFGLRKFKIYILNNIKHVKNLELNSTRFMGISFLGKFLRKKKKQYIYIYI
jgi:hypothetical protein